MRRPRTDRLGGLRPARGRLPGRRLVRLLVVVAFVAACAATSSMAWFGRGEGAEDVLVNCNEVSLADRCACNERISYALANRRPVIPETQGSSWTAIEMNNMIAIQQERLHRLRTFYAPGGCENDPRASEDSLPIAPQHTGGWLDLKSVERHLKPVGTNIIDVKPRAGVSYVRADMLLPGRWEGWQMLFGDRPSPISFHVIAVMGVGTDGDGLLVKACSDQGLVFGQVKDGYLELPRSDSSDMAYSIRLWKSAPPHSQDLEGVTLLEVRPGQVIVAGLAWVSRAVKFDWTTPPSSYFCQDRDLEEQRKKAQEEQKDGP